MSRRPWNLSEKLSILARQAVCPRCGQPLGDLAGVEWDHAVQLAMGGSPEPANGVALHRDCHAVKTFGPPATSAGGDAHARAHARRLERKHGEFRTRILAKEPGKPRERRSKLRSRNTLKRKQHGKKHKDDALRAFVLWNCRFRSWLRRRARLAR